MSKILYKLRIAIYLACICLESNAIQVLSNVPSQFDFTQIEAMASPTNAMEIVNTGDSPLEIHRVRACCGATANITTNSIAPGAAATLTVALKPMAKPGLFRKKVTLYIGRDKLIKEGEEQ